LVRECIIPKEPDLSGIGNCGHGAPGREQGIIDRFEFGFIKLVPILGLNLSPVRFIGKANQECVIEIGKFLFK
jgi:hypothetical protein